MRLEKVERELIQEKKLRMEAEEKLLKINEKLEN